MCTLTWHTDDRGTRVFFNRDEQRTRLPALPPSLHLRNGVQWLAPVDPNAGGTWLAANDQGMAVAILNHYDAEHAKPSNRSEHRSRGQLVMDLADVRAPAEILARLSAMHLEQYRPFILVGLHASGRVGECRWDGSSLQVGGLTASDLPVTTSSFKTEEVLAARRAKFRALVGSGVAEDEQFEAYHKSRDPLGGPYSVTMTRADAMTVSYCRVDLGLQAIRYSYQDRLREGEDPGYAPVVEIVLARP